MPRIDPLQLLNTLQVLLASNGSIKGREEVTRVAQLMHKFSKKLVSKCIYVMILNATSPDLLDLFMKENGWELINSWLADAITSSNWSLVADILLLLNKCPVTVEILQINSEENRAPKLIRILANETQNIKPSIKNLASKILKKWIQIVQVAEGLNENEKKRLIDDEKKINSDDETLDNNAEDSSCEGIDDDASKEDKLMVRRRRRGRGGSTAPRGRGRGNKNINSVTSTKDSDVLIGVKKTGRGSRGGRGSRSRGTRGGRGSRGGNSRKLLRPKSVDEIPSSDDTSSDEDKKESESKILPVQKLNKSDHAAEIKEESNDSESSTSQKLSNNNKSALEKNPGISVLQSVVEEVSEKIKNEKPLEKAKEKKEHSQKDKAENKSEENVSKHKEKTEHHHRSNHHHHEHRHSSSSNHHHSSSSNSHHHHSGHHHHHRHHSDKHKDKHKEKSSKHDNEKSKSSEKSKKRHLDKLDREVERAKKKALEENPLLKHPESEKVTEDSDSEERKNKIKQIAQKLKAEIQAKKEQSSVHSLSKNVKEEKPIPKEKSKGKSTLSFEDMLGGLDTMEKKVVKNAPSKSRMTGLLESSKVLEAKNKRPPTRVDREKTTLNLPKSSLKPPLTLPLDNLLPIPVADNSKTTSLSPSSKSEYTPKHNLTDSHGFMDALFSQKEEPRKKKRRLSEHREKLNAEAAEKEKQGAGTEANASEDLLSPTKIKPTFNFYQDTLESTEKQITENKEEEKVGTDSPNKDEEIIDDNSHSVGSNANSTNSGSPSISTEEREVRGVLVYHKGQGRKKKNIRWKRETDLVSVFYFQMDETERVNVNKLKFGELRQMELHIEKEALKRSKTVGYTANDFSVDPVWKPLMELDVDPPVEWGKDSLEKDKQANREKVVLRALYFQKNSIPDSPVEPDTEPIPRGDIQNIPTEDVTGNPDSISDYRGIPFPEPIESAHDRSITESLANIPGLALNPALNALLKTLPTYSQSYGMEHPDVMEQDMTSQEDYHMRESDEQIMYHQSQEMDYMYQQQHVNNYDTNEDFSVMNNRRENVGFRPHRGNPRGRFWNNRRPPRGFKRGTGKFDRRDDEMRNRKNSDFGTGRPSNFRTKPCKFFSEKGFCRDGDNCHFLHERN